MGWLEHGKPSSFRCSEKRMVRFYRRFDVYFMIPGGKYYPKEEAMMVKRTCE